MNLDVLHLKTGLTFYSFYGTISTVRKGVHKVNKQINFDMDGTLADFYGVEGWLSDLIEERTRPYVVAKPLLNFSSLARLLNRLQREGWELQVISWVSKSGSAEYHELIRIAKLNWLARHLPSVKWNAVIITAYGEAKEEHGAGILFDDNEDVREAWGEGAYDVDNILEVLKGLK